ncbi:hypothetical protein MACK_003675 [Theileria orientalis]|uniref:Uncharacterized protein n=1 Tax=Theileria orientalis TaxID=68886 RepID=A0A976XI23_THEOR|nr:hypothetical protein MACK_003675 [Theileria orientalis]
MTVIYLYNEYEHFKVVSKIHTHTLIQPTEGCIYVFKGGWNCENYLTLTTDGPYSSAKLAKVDVYFNKHDTSNTPLLFVLHFENGTENGVENRYYRMSSYDKDATGCKTKSIDELCEYKNESDILCALIQENDALTDFLTYDIMQRPNGAGCTYNCNKIEVTEVKNGDSQPQLGTGFTRFKHTPKNGRTNGAKPACVVYNCNTLLDSTGTEELGGVQGQQYQSVTVYFGERAKRPCTDKCKAPGAKAATCTKGEGSTCPPAATDSASPGPACTTGPGVTSDPQDVPLLLALHKQGNGDGGNNNTDYYVHRRKAKNGETGNNDTYYWVKLTLPTNGGNGNELSQLLKDIGLSNQLSGTSSSVRVALGQKPNGAENGQTNNLTLLLKRLEFDLTDSVVILLDKNKTNCAGGYGDTEIGQAISTLQTGGKNGNINPLKLSNGDNKIKVTDAKNGLSECLKKYGYCVVAHDFEKAVSGLGAKCSAGLRFLIHTRDNGTKYRELKLYQSDKTGPANLEYKYYQNGGTNGESKVYVCLGGGRGGRALLGGKARKEEKRGKVRGGGGRGVGG